MKNTTFLLFIFLSTSLFAQKYIKIYNQAILRLQEKDTFSAEKLLLKVVKKNPDYVEAHIQLAQVYLHTNRETAFYLHNQRIKELDPKNLLPYVFEFQLKYKQQDFNACYKIGAELLERDSLNEIGLALCTEKALMDGDLVKSNRLLTNLQRVAPEKKAYHLLYAEYYAMQNNEKMAWEHITIYLSEHPQNADSYKVTGYCKYLRGEYSSAYLDMEQSLVLHEQTKSPDSNAYFYMGLIHLKLERYSEAILDFDKALNLRKTPNAYHNRAFAKIQLTDYQGAKADLQTAIQEENALIESFELLANLHIETEEYQSGVDFFTFFLKQKKHLAGTYFARAVLWFEMDSLKEAVTDINQAVYYNDSLPNLYFLKASMEYEHEEAQFIDSENYDEVDEETEERFYVKLLATAEQTVQKAARWMPNQDAFNYRLALFYIQYDYYEKAVPLLERCIKNDFNQAISAYMLGNIFLEEKKYPQAVLHLEKAVQLEPENETYVYYLAQAYYKNKQQAKFCEYIQKAVQMGVETSLTDKCK